VASETSGAQRFGAELDPVLARLTRHALTLDIVALLAAQPLSPRALRARLRTRRQRLEPAVRVPAAHGLIDHANHPGTWDQPIPTRVPLTLTGPGRRLAEQLEQFDITVAIYEHLLHGPPTPGGQT
jgi:hypothetical protein